MKIINLESKVIHIEGCILSLYIAGGSERVWVKVDPFSRTLREAIK